SIVTKSEPGFAIAWSRQQRSQEINSRRRRSMPRSTSTSTTCTRTAIRLGARLCCWRTFMSGEDARCYSSSVLSWCGGCSECTRARGHGMHDQSFAKQTLDQQLFLLRIITGALIAGVAGYLAYVLIQNPFRRPPTDHQLSVIVAGFAAMILPIYFA